MSQKNTDTRPTRPGYFRSAVGATVAFVVLLTVGLVWIALTYATQAGYPIPGLGNYNLVVGVGLAVLSAPAGIVAVILWVIVAVRRGERG